MKKKKINKQKRCVYCGRFFYPDPRAGEKQKACFSPECKRKRKREAQEAWKKKNPQCLKNHYQDYVKAWREKKRGHPAKTDTGKQSSVRLERLILLIPADKMMVIRDEISLKRITPHTFAVDGV